MLPLKYITTLAFFKPRYLVSGRGDISPFVHLIIHFKNVVLTLSPHAILLHFKKLSTNMNSTLRNAINSIESETVLQQAYDLMKIKQKQIKAEKTTEHKKSKRLGRMLYEKIYSLNFKVRTHNTNSLSLSARSHFSRPQSW